MSSHTPRVTYPGTRKFQRLHLRRFDLGKAANDAAAPGNEPRSGKDGFHHRRR